MGRFDIRTRSGQISGIIQGVQTVDSDAQAFYDRVTAAGGSLTATEENAINTFVISIKAKNLWSNFFAIYPMVGGSAAACAQNLKSSNFTGTFAGGWTFASTGVTPNGTSAYMDTALNTSTELTKTSAHLSVYVRTNSNAGQPYDLANSSDSGASSNPTYLITRYSNNVLYFGIADQNYSTTSGTSDSRGFSMGATNGSSTQKIYKNGSLVNTGTAGAGSLANNNLYLGANNGNNTATLFSNKQYAFASIGSGLTDADALDIYTIVQEFQTSLSRNV